MSQQTFTDGQVLTGAEMMGIPQGLIAAARSGTATINTTTSPGQFVAGFTVTLGSNRNIRLRASISGIFSLAAGIASLALNESGVGIICITNFGDGLIDGAGTVEAVLATGILGTSPSAGAHTYSAQMWCAGGGTFTLNTGLVAGILTCEDV
jgi:hypothetical protein